MDYYPNSWIRVNTAKRRRKVPGADDEADHVMSVLCQSQTLSGRRRRMLLFVFLCTFSVLVTEIQGNSSINPSCCRSRLKKCIVWCWTAQCFGGVETYEKTAGTSFATVTNLQGLVSQPGTAVTRDCAALCKQTPTCAAFTVGQYLVLNSYLCFM